MRASVKSPDYRSAYWYRDGERVEYEPRGGFNPRPLRSTVVIGPAFRSFPDKFPAVPDDDDVEGLLQYINKLATIYRGEPTRLDHIGSRDPEIVKSKSIMIKRIVIRARWATRVLNKYTSRQLETIGVRRLPVVSRAFGMIRECERLWFDWFWR